MNRFIKILLILIGLLGLVYFGGLQYFNSGGLEPDNTVWQSYIGRDTTVGILPDAYANYYTYTLVRTDKNTGFKIQGKFPDTRYFSFNVYSLEDYKTQGSLVDYQIKSDSGKPNPFIADKDSIEVGTNYTSYILPEKYADKELPNQLSFGNDVRFLVMVMRLYDFNQDDYGGVGFPTIQAITLDENGGETGKEVEITPVNLPRNLDLRGIVQKRGLPKMVERLSVVFKIEETILSEKPQAKPYTENQNDAPIADSKPTKNYYSIPFHGVNPDGFIENNDNRYLLAGITKQPEEVYVFRFKTPTYTTGYENINQTEVRYWSFNLGNSATYNFNAIKDEDAILDKEGYVTIVLGDKEASIEERVKALGFNFLEWKMTHQKAIILFRHMLADPNFEVQIDEAPPMA
ncbi:MAG: hypothetical protein AB8B69_04570 [Chitinophagales bacterium]